MNRTALIAAGALTIGLGLALHLARAQQPGVSRTDLLRQDMSVAGREVIQVRVDLDRGASFPKHQHPGEEVAYVLEGTLEYRLDGGPPRRLEPGDVLFIPAGAAHEVVNVGAGRASELATYIVEKGKPLLVLVE